jgi:hypothetical protein
LNGVRHAIGAKETERNNKQTVVETSSSGSPPHPSDDEDFVDGEFYGSGTSLMGLSGVDSPNGQSSMAALAALGNGSKQGRGGKLFTDSL